MSWPRLSESLSHYSPEHCAKCGEPHDPRTHITWQECDDLDRPVPRYVILCSECSDKLIEPHPRLYIPLERDVPVPGAVGLCTSCVHRDKLRCTHPGTTFNGGTGLEMIGPKPSRVHVYRRGGHHRSGWIDVYPGPPTHCTGRETSAQ